MRFGTLKKNLRIPQKKFVSAEQKNLNDNLNVPKKIFEGKMKKFCSDFEKLSTAETKNI